MTTVYALLNQDAKRWWYHKRLRDCGNHDEARERERASIRSTVRSLRNALYVSIGRGGHTVHGRYIPHAGGGGTESRLQGYESADGPTVQAAIRCGIPVIDTTTIPDSACGRLLSLPMVATDSARIDHDRAAWHRLSYVALEDHAALMAALGATIHNLDVAADHAGLAAYEQRMRERRAAYDAERNDRASAAAAAPLEIDLPERVNIPRGNGSKRMVRAKTVGDKLASAEGFPTFGELVETVGADSVVPGICWLCESYTAEVEPDCTEGHCEICGEGSVISAVELMLTA